MDQRSSSLQQRLQQRRDMFFKSSADGGSSLTSSTSGSSSTATSSSVSSAAIPSIAPSYPPRIGTPSGPTISTPVSAPPQPPPTAPRNVKDALSILNSSKSAGVDSESSGIRKYSSSSATGDSNHHTAGKPAVPTKPSASSSSRFSHPTATTNNHHNKNDASTSSSSAATTTTTGSTVSSSKKPLHLEGYVGFANLPNQVYRKAVKRGFEFTLMAVGESGLGKSTLINSMFLTDVYSPDYPGPSQRIKKTVQVEASKVMLKESGVNLALTIVDTPGFGDAVDNSNCWDPVLNFVESQFEAFLDAETRVNRVTLPDTRVHACLYFIGPSGHGLKPLDVEFMKRLHDKVNIIPVIAKADTMTPEELEHFKKQIKNQIAQSEIKIYEFPDCEGEEENEKRENQRLKERVPFAVVGSNTLIETSDGKKVRGRKYPWGIVDIESMEHCDFVPLRNMLIRSHLQDLKEVTNVVHYENFRCKKLAGVTGGSAEKIPNKNPLAQIEEERREHHQKLAKMEKEMEEVFERKVREKRQKLADSEADLEKRHRESKEKLEQQKKDLEKQRSAFLIEKQTWESINGVTMDDLKRLSLESLDGGGKQKKKGGLSGVSFRMGR